MRLFIGLRHLPHNFRVAKKLHTAQAVDFVVYRRFGETNFRLA